MSRTKRPRKAKPSIGPSRREQQLIWASEGDFESLYSELLNTLRGTGDIQRLFALLLKALEVRAAHDAAEFADALFNRMIAITGWLVFRSHHYLFEVLGSIDRSASRHGYTGLTHELVTKLVPSLVELQSTVADLAQSQAATARLWQLTRGRAAGRHASTTASKTSQDTPAREFDLESIVPGGKVAAFHRVSAGLSTMFGPNGHVGGPHASNGTHSKER